VTTHRATGRSVTDPSNLLRVMPAEGGNVHVEHVVVLVGGEAPDPEALVAVAPDLADAGLVVAADSGLHHAAALGLHVHAVVGDLDSADPAAVAAARDAGAEVDVHPVDKDATDLELALRAARDRGGRRVTVVGGGGGRHDHLLANALVLTSPEFADLHLDAFVGTARCTVVRTRAALTGAPGSLCSLLAVGGPARGVRTEGLRFALHGEDLTPGSTRGVSNELVAARAGVTVTHGVLLVVQPHALGDPGRPSPSPNPSANPSPEA
jgi:thiamine pyrophosphokinase